MEPILENIELPSPNPKATPNWNPANAPIPLEFYDDVSRPRDSDTLNSSFADFNLDGDSAANSTFELEFSDPEFQSFEEESDTSSVKSGDRKKIAKGRNRVDKKREWGLASPVSPIPRNSKRTETLQYHLISPIFKDRCHYVSKDHPKFKELEGKDPEFDECRYKYFVICVGSHYWKRTRNQVVRAARSPARRQNAIQVCDRRMNVQTFYYSLTFELETMAPVQLRSYSDVIKAIKTRIPPQAPQMFSVTYTTFGSPVNFTVTSQALTSPLRSNNLPELIYSKDFRGCKEVYPLAAGNFKDNLDELSHWDAATTKSGRVLVTAVQCANVDTLGEISQAENRESQTALCGKNVKNVLLEAGAHGLGVSSPHSRIEKFAQLTPNSSIFKAVSGTTGQVIADSSPNSASPIHKTVHTTTVSTSIKGVSVTPPAPPERTLASMSKAPEGFVSPVTFQASESHSNLLTNCASLDPDAMNKYWIKMEDPVLIAEWDKLNEVTIIENPSLKSEETKELNQTKHKCAFAGADGLCRCCHFSHAHAHEGHYQDRTHLDITGDHCGSNTSLDTLINELWTLSKPQPNDSGYSQFSQPEWSCDVTELKSFKKTTDSTPATSRKRRSSSPRLPEDFVSDLDAILKKHIADLESVGSLVPKSPSLSTTTDSQKPAKTSTLDLQEVGGEDRSQDYEMDALGDDEELKYVRLRHSPIDSDLDSSSFSSYDSLRSQPKKDIRRVMFKDETEAFEYFRVKHFDSPYAEPDVEKYQAQVSTEPPSSPNRGSPKTSTRMFCDESDAFKHFKINHFQKNDDTGETSQKNVRARQKYIEQLNNYTPRIQPAVPKRKDSSKRFQMKLMELSRLSAACGEVADQIKHDHQEYWSALTNDFKVPSQNEKSLVSEAYQRVSMLRGTSKVAAASRADTQTTSSSQPAEIRKAVQTDLKTTGMISAAVSDNIVNMASSVSQNQPSSIPGTMRNEIRIDITPSHEKRNEGPSLASEGQGHVLGQGFWSTSPRDIPRLKTQNDKRSVTWCDDVTSTDDDLMSDSSASLTPERKLDTACTLKSIQKTHSQKKKKKVSWSDDCNTDDDRHSSSTSLSSVFEPNSPDTPRHFSNASSFGSTTTLPPVNKQGDGPGRSSHNFQRNISWPVTDMRKTHRQQKACPIYGQPILCKSGQVSYQQTSGVSSHQISRHDPPGSAKTSIGVQRFKVDKSLRVGSPKPQGFPSGTAATKHNGSNAIKNQEFKC